MPISENFLLVFKIFQHLPQFHHFLAEKGYFLYQLVEQAWHPLHIVAFKLCHSVFLLSCLFRYQFDEFSDHITGDEPCEIIHVYLCIGYKSSFIEIRLADLARWWD